MSLRILVLGGSGLTGTETIKILLKKGYYVRTITRHIDNIKIDHNTIDIRVGNVLEQEFINNSLKDIDYVINCLGIGGKGNSKPDSTISNNTRLLIRAMQLNKVKKLIAMSNVGAGDSWFYYPWLFRKIVIPVFMPWLLHIIQDKNRMEDIIRHSDIKYTIVRCPNILEGNTKNKVRSTTDGKGIKYSIMAVDVAEFLVSQISSDEYNFQSPSISN